MDGSRIRALQPNNAQNIAVSTHTTTELANLIDKRHRCLVQLRDLGRKQAELIEAGEMSTLLRLISTKNQLIAALQAIEQALAPFHQQDPDQRQWHSTELRAHCSKLAAECQRLLQEVMELEKRNELNMIERRDQLAVQLQAAKAASTARGAYQAHQISPPQGPHHSTATPIAPLSASNQGEQLDLHSEA